MDPTSILMKQATDQNRFQRWEKRLSDIRARLGTTRETLTGASHPDQGEVLLAIADEIILLSGELSSLGVEEGDAITHAGCNAEQRRLEEQLAHQGSILDHIQDAVITFDKDLKITSWNNGAEKLYGYSAEEAVGQVIFNLLRTELTNEERRDTTHKVIDSGSFSTEAVQYTKNGERIFVESNTIPMRDAIGEVIGYITDNRDITARKKVEDEREMLLLNLEKERNLWMTMVENMVDPVTVCDAQGQATYMNEAYKRLLQMEIRQGLEMEEHSDYYQIYHPDGRPFASRDLPLQKAALENEIVRNVEIVQHSATGQKYHLIWNAVPLRAEDGSSMGAIAVGRDITAQRAAENSRAELFAENQRQKVLLENIFDVGPFGISVISGSDFTIQMANPGYRDLTPHPEIDPAGKQVGEVWKPEEGFNIAAMISRAIQNNESVRNYKLDKVFPDGSRRFYSISLQPLLHSEKKSLLCVILDVTEIELAREEAEDGRQTLEALMHHIPEGITIADAPDAKVKLISNHGREIVGFRSEELVGRSIFERWNIYDPVTGDPAPVERIPLGRAIRDGETTKDEEWLLENAQGERIPILINAGPIRNQGGEIVGGISAWRDITDRKQIEAALQESEERYRNLLHAISISVWRATPDGKVMTDVSGKGPFPHARSGDQTDGFLSKFHPDDRNAVAEAWRKAIENKELFEIEHRFLSKDGNYYWVHSRAVPHFNAAGEVIEWIGFSADITDRKKAEQAVKDYSNQLKEYSEHLEKRVRERTEELVNLQRRLVDNVEKERLWVSQELHDGPMQEIYGLLYKLAALKDDPDDYDWLAEVTSIQEKLKLINEDLRSVARELRPTSLTPFGLEKAIREHGERIDEENPDLDISLDLMVDGNLLPEHVRLALFRIYQTALANVIRHAQAKHVSVRFSYDEQDVLLEIVDDGKGFEVPKRIRTLALKGHLGLAGAVERAESIGGKLEVESAPGKGTRLRVSAPLRIGESDPSFS